MKKIYAFSLDDEDYPTGIIKSEISTIAYLMYEELKNMEEYSGSEILVMNKYLKENELLDVYRNGMYAFSKFKDEKSIYCEPFLLNDTSFGITVYDDSITDSEMSMLVKLVSGFIHQNINFIMNTVSYEGESYSDEFGRMAAIKRLNEKKVKSLFPIRVKKHSLIKKDIYNLNDI